MTAMLPAVPNSGTLINQTESGLTAETLHEIERIKLHRSEKTFASENH